MGKGAYMTVFNDTDTTFVLQVSDAYCMYDAGEEGSNLAAWEGQTLEPEGQLPPGDPQYIEAKASGTCSTHISQFTVAVDANLWFEIREVDNEYWFECSERSRFNAAVLAPGGHEEGSPGGFAGSYKILIRILPEQPA